MKKTVSVILIILILSTVLLILIPHSDNIQSLCYNLSDLKLEGRLTGTKGNIQARDYITSYYKKLGLEPLYNNTYHHPYKHTYDELDNSNIETKLTVNGDSKILEYGVDYLPRMFNRQLELSSAVTTTPTDDCFLLMESLKSDLDTSMTCGRIVKCNNFMKNLCIYNSKPIIQVTPEIYDYIKANIDSCQISIKYKIDTKTITANNVIAKLPGNNSKNAIILSAHFDHVGKSGDTVYTGALDNCSGSSLLLDLAKKLKGYSKDNKLGQDIIFCSFNGEESGRQGSRAFVKDLVNSNEYENIYNINLDCIGYKNTYYIIGDSKDKNNQKLMNTIGKYLSSNNIKYSIESNIESDHTSFIENNINSVCIGESEIDTLHKGIDTVDKIDMVALNKFSSLMFDFLVEYSNEIYPPEPNINISSLVKVDNYIDIRSAEYERLVENLNINEYKNIKSPDGKGIIQLNRFDITYNSLSDYNKIFPNSVIPLKYADYTISTIYVRCNRGKSDEYEVNRVFKYKDFGINNITSWDITYTHMKKEDKILRLIITNNELETIHKIDTIDDYSQIYNIHYGGDKNQYINCIETNATLNNKNYYIIVEKSKVHPTIKDTYKSDWFDHSPEKTKDFIRNIRFEELIKGLLK